MAMPRLLWDVGTAYDLFVSLDVLHRPSVFGLRGAWAAGVRARLPAAERETLEQAQSFFFGPPFHWVHNLPDPKDGATALWVLGRTQPGERLPSLMLFPTLPLRVREVLQNVAARQAWDDGDREVLKAHAPICGNEHKFKPEVLAKMLDAWSQAEEFGERYLQALRAYYEVFFAEEEQRIQPALATKLAQAKDLAQRSKVEDLLDELSQGLRFVEPPQVAELVLVPSYWSTPIMFFAEFSAERHIWLFGAKPADASLVPGEIVPDALLGTLKALSDPTRLRILRYATHEPITAAELSRRLRLRIPTVTHHLRILRLATLVQLTVKEVDGQDRDLYTVRFEAVEAAFRALKSYLDKDLPR
jgi:DNA-binding transcriptional ArsR family regulator